MLIRFFVNNVYSFGEEKEFNMLPGPKRNTEKTRLKEHVYKLSDEVGVLKLASIYGANAAGKSNFVKALFMLQGIVVGEQLFPGQTETRFKFADTTTPQTLGVEFFQDGTAYYYAVEITGNSIATEELYQSGLGVHDDALIFERKTNEKGLTSIRFFKDFEKSKENILLKKVIENNLTKPNQPIFKLLTTLNNPSLISVVKAFAWFDNALTIISPDMKPTVLPHMVDVDANYHKFAQDMMCAFHVGITGLSVDKKTLHEFCRDDNLEKQLIVKLENTHGKMLVKNIGKQNVAIVKENNDIFVKQIKLQHLGKNSQTVSFDLNDESDGTVRLLDFVPVFKRSFSDKKVYIIDEVERSIHPLLIKELVSKFSKDHQTQGQLIFTTHEANLLDQEIFRQDEIWFTEKNSDACTDMYPLSDFKEHGTIDIRKGYLTGRYGSIPFLGNLHDLNWHAYDK